MLQSASGTPTDSTQCPILVRLRALNERRAHKNPLLDFLAQELGLTEEANPTSSDDAATVVRKGNYDELKLFPGQSLASIVSGVLNRLSVTLLFDGLDEVNGYAREQIESDIRELLELNETCRVFITCRTGDFRKPIPGTRTLEVCDLGTDDIRRLARIWLGDEAEFFVTKLGKNSSLAELGGRPLFLAHMLNIYRLGGQLPAQPCEVYELMTLLLIREWDRERGVIRKSAYADFGAEAKLRFLAALAYEFTYVNKVQSFTHHDLQSAYSKICLGFALPSSDSQAVAQELEAHTGIIVEAGYHSYEFSHLTIQEYLTAHYLVRTRFAEARLTTYLTQFPAPLAIATALSAEPAAWLASILLPSSTRAGGASVSSFLTRLQLENPRFTEGAALGYCMLALCFRYAASHHAGEREEISGYVYALAASSVARRSFVEVVTSQYSLTLAPEDESIYKARLRSAHPENLDETIRASLPKSGRVDRGWLVQTFLEKELTHSPSTKALVRK
jgi:hypothetical protein